VPFNSLYTLSFQKRFYNPATNSTVGDTFLKDGFSTGFESFRYQIAYSKPFEPAAFSPVCSF